MRCTSPLFVALVLCILFAAVSAGREGFGASNLTAYANRQTLTEGFELYWDGDDEWVHIALVGRTLGWLALGIGEQTSGRYVLGLAKDQFLFGSPRRQKKSKKSKSREVNFTHIFLLFLLNFTLFFLIFSRFSVFSLRDRKVDFSFS